MSPLGAPTSPSASINKNKADGDVGVPRIPVLALSVGQLRAGSKGRSPQPKQGRADAVTDGVGAWNDKTDVIPS